MYLIWLFWNLQPPTPYIDVDSFTQVTIRIINDEKWDPAEEFFLRLTLLNKSADMVKLGGLNIMEVTIIDDDGKSYENIKKISGDQ
jgi:hypothetical protein